MTYQNFKNIDKIEKKLEAKAALRAKKKRPKMKVSGGRIKELQKIIIKKTS